MRTLIGSLLMVAASAVAGGGEDKSAPPDPKHVAVQNVLRYKLLPDGATDVRGEGDKWVSFTLVLDGVTHRYMLGYWYGSHNEVGKTIVRID